jgi:hypothetical protein
MVGGLDDEPDQPTAAQQPTVLSGRHRRKGLGGRRDRLLGTFRVCYTRLIHVVSARAKQKHLSAVATRPPPLSVGLSQFM